MRKCTKTKPNMSTVDMDLVSMLENGVAVQKVKVSLTIPKKTYLELVELRIDTGRCMSDIVGEAVAGYVKWQQQALEGDLAGKNL